MTGQTLAQGVVMSLVLFSNNLCMVDVCQCNGSSAIIMESSLQVLLAARDKIHNGWRLLHHPLYGNYRPYQQPYRSLLLEKKDVANASAHTPADVTSLHFIEEALLIYSSTKVLLPDEAPEVLRADCAQIDFELMRTVFEQVGWNIPVIACFSHRAKDIHSKSI